MKLAKQTSKAKVIVYLKEGINKLARVYPKYFDEKSTVLLEKLTIKDNEIDYKNLNYKICFLKEDKDNFTLLI